MKALTVRNPYAWLIVAGIKPIENRSWSTRYRGPLLIHAAINPHKDSVSEIEQRFGVSIDPAQLTYGGIVGRVDLVDVVTAHISPWFTGRYGFVLANPVVLPFRPQKGAQRFFRVSGVPPLNSTEQACWPTS